jgi:hypothetical protein
LRRYFKGLELEADIPKSCEVGIGYILSASFQSPPFLPQRIKDLPFSDSSLSLPMLFSGANRALSIEASFFQVFLHYTWSDLRGAGQPR